METLFTYLFKSSLWLVAFYLVYKALLQRETLFAFNRFFLLTGMIASLAMPAVVVYRTVRMDIPLADNLVALPVSPVVHQIETVSWSTLILRMLLVLYGIGIIVLIIRTVIVLFPLLKAIRNHSGKNCLIFNSLHPTPFSFGKYIFIPDGIQSNEMELILRHESTHTKEWHYIDVWLAKSICILQFFNPLVWLYAKAVQDNCEFIADSRTIENPALQAEYLHLLVRYSTAQQFNSLSLHFAYPLILKRIKIMKQKKSNKLASLKSLAVLPLAGIIMVGYAQTKVVESQPVKTEKSVVTNPLLAQNTTSAQKKTATTVKITTTTNQEKAVATTVPTQPASTNEVVVVGYASKDNETDNATSKNNDEIFTVVEEMPRFDGDVSQYLARNIKYPVDAQRRGVQGRVICQFVVEKDGSISSVTVVRSVDPLLDAEACRVIYGMPQWIPGKQRGIVVRVKYTLPIYFKLSK
jgi:TonB family protein